MLCPNCGASVPDGLEKCLSCGSRVHASEVDEPSSYRGFSSSSEEPKKSESAGMKGISLFLGIIEIIIGLFYSAIMFSMFASDDMGFGIFATAFYLPLAVILPLVGVILIGVNKKKVGGILLIIGSVFCFPVGIIGVIGGWMAVAMKD
ncbi:MAG: hypothetical protein ACMUIG_05205 [Thermoplasmatota archaeon]